MRILPRDCPNCRPAPILSKAESVPNPNKVQTFCGRYETETIGAPGFQSGNDLLELRFTKRNARHGAYHQPHHLVEKSVTGDIDGDAWSAFLHGHGPDR